MNDNLTKLQDLTQRLPLFPEAITQDDCYKEYKMIRGDCHGWLVYTNATTVAVHKWFNSIDSSFPEHAHSVAETIVVFEGQMRLKVNDKELILNEQNSFTIPAQTKHNAVFDVSCRYITVTVPPAPEFPGISEGDNLNGNK